MIYCIDTSALIDLDRLYSKEVFPSIVITHEEFTGNLAKRRLPDICRHLGLKTYRLIHLFKEEGWKIGV